MTSIKALLTVSQINYYFCGFLEEFNNGINRRIHLYFFHSEPIFEPVILTHNVEPKNWTQLRKNTGLDTNMTFCWCPPGPYNSDIISVTNSDFSR